MMSDSDSEHGAALTQEQIQNAMGERVTVEGDATPGQRVEIEYASNAGGSYGTDRPCTISGELVYVSEYGTDSHQMVVRDDDAGRSVAFITSSRRSLKSLAARRTKRGRSLGNILSVTFTDEDVSALAPVVDVIRSVIPGDTVFVEGSEYGVVSVSERGPEKAPDNFSAILTTANGEEYVLEANGGYNTASVTFSVRFSGRDGKEDVDPNAVSTGRFRERLFDSDNEGLDTEDTTDALPAPHYAREGERVTVTLTGEDHGEEQVSGEVTDVRYFTRKESSWFSGPEKEDPETTVELDDGRKVTLRNASRKGSRHITRSRREDIGEDGMVRAMVVTPREDADNEYAHVEAVDIQREDGGDDPTRTDGGRALADGGEDVETLAEAVSDALASSDIAMNRVSVSVGHVDLDVTVQGNGHVSREDWNELRDAITDALDAAGFQYTAKPEWAFVRVDGREVRTDGGSVGAREPDDVDGEDRHADVKQRAIALDAVVMVKSAGEHGEFVAVYRSEDGELDEYHTLMDLAGYRSVDPYTALDEDPGGVTGEDITLDLWERDAATDGGGISVEATEDTPTTLAMSAVYAALAKSPSGGPVTVVPSSRTTGCSIKYSGSIGRIITDELDALGVEASHGFDTNGPGPGDRKGKINVMGISEGGDGDE